MCSILERDVTGLAWPLETASARARALRNQGLGGWSVGRVRSLIACGDCRLERYRHRRCLPSIVCRSAEGRLRWRVTIAITRLYRPRRSRAGWDARRPRSRRTCMTPLS
jgi:hypothetical protein